ncbi:hypothetical protein C0991_003177 [Blastosporella zonata]|nr:hypothetical protein C0991_003177 [Blastosporella zonata]
MAMLFRPNEQQAKKFLFDIMTSPEDYASHLKQYSAGIALGVSFGMSIEQAHVEAPHLIANTAAVGADVCVIFRPTSPIPDARLTAVPWFMGR